jgi:hypothetical protein
MQATMLLASSNLGRLLVWVLIWVRRIRSALMRIPGIYSHQEFLGFIPIKNSWDLFPTEIPGIYSRISGATFPHAKM